MAILQGFSQGGNCTDPTSSLSPYPTHLSPPGVPFGLHIWKPDDKRHEDTGQVSCVQMQGEKWRKSVNIENKRDTQNTSVTLLFLIKLIRVTLVNKSI